MAAEGAVPATSPRELVAVLAPPRPVGLMLPAAIGGRAIDYVAPHLSTGHAIVDGGNSLFQDDIARATRRAGIGLAYVDGGTSGGVFGLDRGYCLMVGGEAGVVSRLAPAFEPLAPGAR